MRCGCFIRGRRRRAFAQAARQDFVSNLLQTTSLQAFWRGEFENAASMHVVIFFGRKGQTIQSRASRFACRWPMTLNALSEIFLVQGTRWKFVLETREKLLPLLFRPPLARVLGRNLRDPSFL
jgi:hypothetical protein